MAKKKANMKKEKQNKEAKAEEEIKENKNYNSQLKWILGIIAAIFIIALLTYFIAGTAGRFSYAGLKFEKIKYDKLPLYHSRIPIEDFSGNIIAYYNLYLRNDPRSLGDITVNGTILLKKTTYFSIDPNAEFGCEDRVIAVGNAVNFLRGAGIDLKVATPNQTYAQEKNATYMTCAQAINSSVIILTQGNRNIVNQDSQNCYTIEFKDCDINLVTEKFILAAYAHSVGLEI